MIEQYSQGHLNMMVGVDELQIYLSDLLNMSTLSSKQGYYPGENQRAAEAVGPDLGQAWNLPSWGWRTIYFSNQRTYKCGLM